jgi:hypothetical protein
LYEIGRSGSRCNIVDVSRRRRCLHRRQRRDRAGPMFPMYLRVRHGAAAWAPATPTLSWRPDSNSRRSRALHLTDVHPDPSLACPLWLQASSVIGPVVPCGRGRGPTPVTVPTPASTAPAGPWPSPCIPIPSLPSANGLSADAAETFLTEISEAHFGSSAGQTKAYADENDDCRNDRFARHSLLPELARLRS